MSGNASAWIRNRRRSCQPVDLGDLALQRVAMVQRPAERIGHALTLAPAGRQPVESAVLALQAAALDLQADDPAIGMTQNEVALVVTRPLGMIAVDHAGRVKHRPLVGELIAQGLEHLALGLALEVLLEERAGKGSGHTRCLPSRRCLSKRAKRGFRPTLTSGRRACGRRRSHSSLGARAGRRAAARPWPRHSRRARRRSGPNTPSRANHGERAR